MSSKVLIYKIRELYFEIQSQTFVTSFDSNLFILYNYLCTIIIKHNDVIAALY